MKRHEWSGWTDPTSVADLAGGMIIGHRANGEPIYAIGGGARNTYEDWIPEEWGGPVITRVQQVSAVEALARSETMGTDTKHVPRSAGVGVETIAKGAPYGEDESTNDDVLLTARKHGKAIRIAEEDLNDVNYVNILATKRADWATSYGKYFDNATLGCTAAENGTTVPYTSLYKALSTTNNDTGYTANDNLTLAGTGGITYDLLSETVGKVEESDFFDLMDMRVIAHPTFRGVFRGIKDDQGRPIFVEGRDGTPDTLFSIAVRWSLGAKSSNLATDSPEGHPFLAVGNMRYLIVGRRSGPESQLIPPSISNTDEALLKMRARRGFAVAHEKAWAILVKNG